MAVRLSALSADWPSFAPRRLSRSEGHRAAGRIRLFEKSNDLTENRTRDLPACNIVPQPTTLSRAPCIKREFKMIVYIFFALSGVACNNKELRGIWKEIPRTHHFI
jgi:hypothetical protein